MRSSNEEKANDSRAYLGVFGFGDDPSVVTRLIGVVPTEAYAKGDHYVSSTGEILLHRESAWRLHNPLPRTAHVDDQIEALLDLIEPYSEGIREAVARYEVGVGCAIFYSDFTPGIHLSENVVPRIAALGLSIDFDLYFLSEEE